MKYILGLLIAASVLARADLVMEQKMESAFMNSNITMKVKGDHVRVDMPGAPTGAITIFIDGKAGTMDTYVHPEKTAVKRSIADAKKLAAEGQKKAGIDPSKLEKPKPTGKMEKIGDWDAEIHEFDAGAIKGKVWVAKDFPNYKAIMEQVSTLFTALGEGYDPSKFDLGGIIVKTEMQTASGKMTATVLKVKEEPVADTEFKAPEGYTVVKQ